MSTRPSLWKREGCLSAELCREADQGGIWEEFKAFGELEWETTASSRRQERGCPSEDLVVARTRQSHETS